jgi:hypothetical protein
VNLGQAPQPAHIRDKSTTARRKKTLPKAPGRAAVAKTRPAVTPAWVSRTSKAKSRPRHAPPRGCAGCWYPGAVSRMRIDPRRYANTALRYTIRRRRTVSPQLQTEAVLRRRVRTAAGRGAEPCGAARQNTEDRRKARARCGCKEAMMRRWRRDAHQSGYCCNSPARPQRQRVLITATAANQGQSRV